MYTSSILLTAHRAFFEKKKKHKTISILKKNPQSTMMVLKVSLWNNKFPVKSEDTDV